MSKPLAEAARPQCWADVAGQDEAVAAIRSAIDTGGWGGRAWWITGVSGTGKTTICKLIAAEGASDWTTVEVRANGLTPAGVEALEAKYAGRSLFGGWCIVVNECHGLRKDTVTALLDALERLPSCCCWVFTTTCQGQARFFADDENGDTAPLVSRCQEIRLVDTPESRLALARRVKAVAMAAGCDGFDERVYVAALNACKGNARMLLQRVESGQLAAEVKHHASKVEAERPVLAATGPRKGAK